MDKNDYSVQDWMNKEPSIMNEKYTIREALTYSEK